MTRVFTKYDKVIQAIHVPMYSDFEAVELTEETDLSLDNYTFTIVYNLGQIEQGLEGVKFAHYETVE